MSKRKNLLERAGNIKDRRRAVRLVADALGIDIDDIEYKFCSDEQWKARPPWSRINEIEHWLVAECRKAMKLTSGPRPMDTVGTND